jgi:hypothetical protein
METLSNHLLPFWFCSYFLLRFYSIIIFISSSCALFNASSVLGGCVIVKLLGRLGMTGEGTVSCFGYTLKTYGLLLGLILFTIVFCSALGW